MTRYIVIHKTPAGVTQDQVIAAARQAVHSSPPGAAWLNSWVAAEAEKLFCEWEAENDEILQVALEPLQEVLPVESKHVVTRIDPAWYAA